MGKHVLCLQCFAIWPSNKRLYFREKRVKYWRGKGFKIIMYLDDGLGGATCYEEALSTSKIIKSDLEQFGFHIAPENCIWTPVQKLDWLGFT